MDRCLWKGKPVSAYDAKNIYGEWDFALKEALVAAGQNKELTCEDCGEYVYYKPGREKEPHFAHFKSDTRLCALADERESEEHRKGKRVLYHYFKERYPNAVMRLSLTHPFRRRSDLFIQFEDGQKLAVEYQCQDMHVTDWKTKQDDYSANGIKALWVLSAREYAGTDFAKRFFAELVAHGDNDGLLVTLDPALLKLGLSKTVAYTDDEGRTVESHNVERFYPLTEVEILPDGRVYQADFERVVTDAELELTNKFRASLAAARELQQRHDAWAQQHQDHRAMRPTLRTAAIRLDEWRDQEGSRPNAEVPRQEAESVRASSSTGPRDNLEVKPAVCRRCGVLTSDYVVYYGVDKTCFCRDCLRN